MPAAFGVIARRFAAPYPDTPFHAVVPNLFTVFLVQILALFYGASAVRDAIEDGTAMFVLTTPTSRTGFLLGVWAALVVNVLLLLELGVVTAFLTWSAGVPGGLPGAALFGRECLSLMGVVAIGAAIYAALFMLLGLWTRHAAVAGVVYYIVFEAGIGWIPGSARRLAISAHLEALLDPGFVTRRMFAAELFNKTTSEIPTTLAATALAVWFAVLLGGMLLRGRTHDFIDLAEAGK
jgi:ABC-type transport system involved in multi-copper enzyme maturation permease subunit